VDDVGLTARREGADGVGGVGGAGAGGRYGDRLGVRVPMRPSLEVRLCLDYSCFLFLDLSRERTEMHVNTDALHLYFKRTCPMGRGGWLVCIRL
jgi:hypothetical protein